MYFVVHWIYYTRNTVANGLYSMFNSLDWKSFQCKKLNIWWNLFSVFREVEHLYKIFFVWLVSWGPITRSAKDKYFRCHAKRSQDYLPQYDSHDWKCCLCCWSSIFLPNWPMLFFSATWPSVGKKGSWYLQFYMKSILTCQLFPVKLLTLNIIPRLRSEKFISWSEFMLYLTHSPLIDG